MQEPNEYEKKQTIRNISADEALQLVEKHKKDPDFVILDVRTPKEFSEGHVGGAKNLDYYAEDFQEQIEKGDKDKKHLICCGSGVRSAKTVIIMRDVGYVEIYNILGGIRVWKQNKLPLTEK